MAPMAGLQVEPDTLHSCRPELPLGSRCNTNRVCRKRGRRDALALRRTRTRCISCRTSVVRYTPFVLTPDTAVALVASVRRVDLFIALVLVAKSGTHEVRNLVPNALEQPVLPRVAKQKQLYSTHSSHS